MRGTNSYYKLHCLYMVLGACRDHHPEELRQRYVGKGRGMQHFLITSLDRCSGYNSAGSFDEIWLFSGLGGAVVVVM